MPVMVLKGERKLSDVVRRAYGEALPAAEARRAEAALVAANPQLSRLRELPPGAMVVVPRMPERAPAPQDETQGWHAGEVAELRASLEAYRKHLGAGLAGEREALAATTALLKSADVKALARSFRESAPYLERVKAAAKDRAAEAEARAAFVKSLARLRADLDELERLAG